LWGLLCGEEVGGGVRIGMGMWMGNWWEGEATRFGVGAGWGGAHEWGGRWWDAEGFVEEVRRSKEWVGEEGVERGDAEKVIGYSPQRRPRDFSDDRAGREGVGIGECPSGKCGGKQKVEEQPVVVPQPVLGIAACPGGGCGM
jgi:hypothetical protein